MKGEVSSEMLKSTLVPVVYSMCLCYGPSEPEMGDARGAVLFPPPSPDRPLGPLLPSDQRVAALQSFLPLFTAFGQHCDARQPCVCQWSDAGDGISAAVKAW